ncbi:putative alpha beta hydrolase family [Diaporthe ampelina]|uniref:Putative alpha beta hydrolase family n=1 Tax=Diaporthe ampelina TaxID=1214573 RepID=A0A0G2I8K1_9PEZI|nr:putative alpha beta hydrolase family [Diaporthe ampelina]
MLVVTTAITTASLYTVVNHIVHPRRPAVLRSPLSTNISRLSPDEKSGLLYPPDYFPGARDVPTPYIAHGLVERGCRVLLFDLFGRGYSDGVGDLPHDERLYVSQALCVLASSELAWTGHGEDEGFHLVGYSLGGGIAIHLAAAFPRMVKTLVLLAPAGMIREENFGTVAKIIFRSGWVPEGLVEIMTRWRLKRPIAESAKRKSKGGPSVTSTPKSHLPGDQAVETTVTSEIADAAVSEAPGPLQRQVLKYVNWQVANHAGFVPAFMSTLRDEIANDEDYRQDVLPLVGGDENVFWADPVPGGHDFPMSHPDQTLERIWRFWGWDEGVAASWVKT